MNWFIVDQVIDREIDAAKVEQQLLTTKAVQAVNNFIKERVFLQVLASPSSSTSWDDSNGRLFLLSLDSSSEIMLKRYLSHYSLLSITSHLILSSPSLCCLLFPLVLSSAPLSTERWTLPLRRQQNLEI
jgi:hypothetical protein